MTSLTSVPDRMIGTTVIETELVLELLRYVSNTEIPDVDPLARRYLCLDIARRFDDTVARDGYELAPVAQCTPVINEFTPRLIRHDEAARDHVFEVLLAVNGNKSMAANILDLERSTIDRRLKGWGVPVVSGTTLCEHIRSRSHVSQETGEAAEVSRGEIRDTNSDDADSRPGMEQGPGSIRSDGGDHG